MAKKKKVTITEKQLEKNGVVEFVHKDSYGITYEMKAYQMGLTLCGRVLSEDGRLIFHNEKSYDDFDTLKIVFDATAVTMQNEQAECHLRYASKAKEQPLSLAERLRQALLARLAA